MKGYRRRHNTSNKRITARTLELNLSTQQDASVSSTPLSAATQGTTTTTTNMADSPSNSTPFKGFIHDNSGTIIPDNIKDYIVALENEIKDIKAALERRDSKITNLENKIQNLEEKITSGSVDTENTLKAAIASHTEQITTINMKVEEAIKDWNLNMHTRLNEYLDFQDDKTEQDKLSDAVIINSPHIPSDITQAQCKETAIRIIQNHVQVIVQNNEIKETRLLGKPGSKHSIMIRLHSYDKRKDLIKSAITMKNGVYINECLTKKRQNLLFRLRKLKQENKIHQCFTRDGKILVRKTSTGQQYTISNEHDFSTFLRKADISVTD